MAEFYFQVSNVVIGKTADGHAGSLPTLPLEPESFGASVAANVSRAILTRMMWPEEPDALPDQVRTAICWKVAAYVSKVGPRSIKAEFRRTAITVADFLIEHPSLVLAQTSFAGIRKLAETAQLRRERHEMEQKTAQVESEVRALEIESGAPPRPVVWREGPYSLEELVHPFHVWEEGFRMHNCLGGVLGIQTHMIKASDLRRLRYWKSIQNEDRHIYSLRRGEKRIATLTHVARRITEIQLSTGDLAAREVLRKVATHLERVYGRMFYSIKAAHLLGCPATNPENPSSLH